MEPEDKKQFAVIMAGVAEEFGGKISKEGLKLKFEAMKEFTIEQISVAATHLVNHREETFPAIPRVKEFRDIIEKIIFDRRSLEYEARKQHEIIIKYFKHYGRECNHVFKNDITRYLMTNVWSFHKLGNMTAKDFEWFRINFIKEFIVYSTEEIERFKILPASDDLKKLESLAINSTKRIGER